ncbi:MAG: hypothetical protein HQM16_06720 [Deltaproteobacteria bacterium]|nr:hypothetical protein [Deltaproteobacteria bacterium]
MSVSQVNVQLESLGLDLSVTDFINLAEDEVALEKKIDEIIETHPDLVLEEVKAEFKKAIDEAIKGLKELEERADEEADICDDEDDEEGEDEWKAEKKELDALQKTLKGVDDEFEGAFEEAMANYELHHIVTNKQDDMVDFANTHYVDGDVIDVELTGGTILAEGEREKEEEYVPGNYDNDQAGLITHNDYEKWLTTKETERLDKSQRFYLKLDFGDRITGITYAGGVATFTVQKNNGATVTCHIKGLESKGCLIKMMSPDTEFVSDAVLKTLPDELLKVLHKGEDDTDLYHVFNQPTAEDKRGNIQFYSKVTEGIEAAVDAHTSGVDREKVLEKTREYIGWIFDAFNEGAEYGLDTAWAKVMTDMATLDPQIKKDVAQAIMMSFALNADQATFGLIMQFAIKKIEGIYLEDGALDAEEMKYIIFMENHVGVAGLYGGTDFWDTDAKPAEGDLQQSCNQIGYVFASNQAGFPFIIPGSVWDNRAELEAGIQGYLELVGQVPFAEEHPMARQRLEDVSTEGQKAGEVGMLFKDLMTVLNAAVQAKVVDEEGQTHYDLDAFNQLLSDNSALLVNLTEAQIAAFKDALLLAGAPVAFKMAASIAYDRANGMTEGHAGVFGLVHYLSESNRVFG